MSTERPRRAEAKARTRTRLIEAARALFEAKGYNAVTLRDVAKQAALSTGAVFASFTGKDELYLCATGRRPPIGALGDNADLLLKALKELVGNANESGCVDPEYLRSAQAAIALADPAA